MVRPEQKAPPMLSPLRLSDQTYGSRKQAPGTPRSYDGSKYFRYALSLPFVSMVALCPQPKSGETTRGPPRMDPPLLC
jgi:hypothetical protein